MLPDDPSAFHIENRPPRPTQGTRAGSIALERAQRLVCLVRDESADGIGAYLDTLNTEALYALTVALAAMVPDDQPADTLLAWLAPIAALEWREAS